VHHACNEIYIDKNFAGVLVIWDRLFGTFEAEHDHTPCRFGITDDFESDNPLRITFHEWRRMLADAKNAAGFAGKIDALFGPPRPERAEPSQERTS
jgi:hypothetical protein